jgi:DNA-binding response OmpR family regulator
MTEKKKEKEEMQRPASPFRVLIAEYDRTLATQATAALVSAGYHATIASDGAQVLEHVRNGSFHLVIIDLDMPRIDGHRLIPLLRGNARSKRIGVLAVTASRNASDHAEAISVGADVVQVKPIEGAELPRVVAGVLASRDCRPTPEPIRPTQYYAMSTGP